MKCWFGSVPQTLKIWRMLHWRCRTNSPYKRCRRHFTWNQL